MKYKTIYADPPWLEVGGGKICRGAQQHYPVMKTKDIIAMSGFIKSISEDNCHLYLWVTNNFLPDGLQVMKAWDFEYKTIITWIKDRFGLGQYFRGNTEHCLFGVKGVLPYKIVDEKRQQGVTGFNAPRTEHSRKPEQMRSMITKVSYPPYIELFARTNDETLFGNIHDGWDVWGNEVESDIAI